MATFTEIALLANSVDFQSKVRVAMVKSAQSIAGEGIGAMTQAQTNKRQITATIVLNGGGGGFSWSLAVGTNATIANAFSAAYNIALAVPDTTIEQAVVIGVAAVADGDIEFTVNSVWDDMSGVTTLDLV